MEYKSNKILLLNVITAFTLLGCGGGSSSDSTVNDETGGESQQQGIISLSSSVNQVNQSFDILVTTDNDLPNNKYVGQLYIYTELDVTDPNKLAEMYLGASYGVSEIYDTSGNLVGGVAPKEMKNIHCEVTVFGGTETTYDCQVTNQPYIDAGFGGVSQLVIPNTIPVQISAKYVYSTNDSVLIEKYGRGEIFYEAIGIIVP
ncbi:MAG: hypothetical protein COA44_13805 [Arcobacter sp.]|nr:MAG: hypothetical protein COA44_13805 [Arcobacter sp.]